MSHNEVAPATRDLAATSLRSRRDAGAGCRGEIAARTSRWRRTGVPRILLSTSQPFPPCREDRWRRRKSRRSSEDMLGKLMVQQQMLKDQTLWKTLEQLQFTDTTAAQPMISTIQLITGRNENMQYDWKFSVLCKSESLQNPARVEHGKIQTGATLFYHRVEKLYNRGHQRAHMSSEKKVSVCSCREGQE